MKRHLILLFVGVSLPFLLAAQQKNSVSITKRVLRIPEVTVVGKRPMKDIGVQRTRFDSVAMKEDAPRYPPWLSGVPLPRIPK